MARYCDWPERLADMITTEQSAPMAFEWGKWDCALFYRRAVLALTGDDPLIDIPPWRSEKAALKALKSAGVKDVREFVAARHKAKPVAMAQRGDLGFPANVERLMFPAVIMGAYAIQRAPDGIVIIDRALIVEAFEV